mmetsp:Transcript_17223/g.25842  ORF Transcript_17223/g.25842 Transcript_17223/m.25842 type:complete len:106 (+) Transcript_17223:1414-1731(+)
MTTARSRHRSALMEEMEGNNNKLLGKLQSQLHEAKSIAIQIGDRVREHNKMLDDMEPGMGNIGSMFKKTLSAMGQLTSGGGSCHMCYLILFVFVFFLLIKFFIMG